VTHPTIAYVPTHLPSYYAEEYQVTARSRAGLEHLADALSFVLVVYEPVVTREDAKRVVEDLAAKHVDFVLLQNSTFAMGDVLLEFAAHRLRLGLWTTEEPMHEGPIMLNGFVSMNLNASVLTRYLRAENLPFKWFYGYPEHPWFHDRFAVTVAALRSLRCLQQARIGLVGGVAPTFFNFVIDERKVRARFGTEVVALELDEVFSRSKRQSQTELARARRAMAEAAQGRVEISSRDAEVSAGLYLALQDLASEEGLDAFAISDWPRFQSELNIHPGMAFSWLDEHDRIPVAAEGDVLGALTMLALREISGYQAMLLDMNDLDFELGAVLMWHCGGSPLGFANDAGVRWTNHTTLGRKVPGTTPIGAVADYIFRPQAVTVARLGLDGDHVFAANAQVIEGRHRGFDGSRGWVADFEVQGERWSLEDVVNTVMVEGLEHHFALAAGHHADVLMEVAAWTRGRFLARVPYRNAMQWGSRDPSPP